MSFKNETAFVSYVLKIHNDKTLFTKLKKGAKESSLDHSSDAFGQKVYTVYTDTIKHYKKQDKLLSDIKDVINKSKIVESLKSDK